MHKKIALITGATSGIGEATALLLAQNNYNVIITGRRADRLTICQEHIRLNSSADVWSLNFDVRNHHEVENAINSLPEEWKNIDVLVNNAGLAVGFEPLHEGFIDDWERMIDTNIKGLLYVSRAVTPLMVARQTGHVVNISSIAGKEVYPNGNVYCASKYSVEAITKGMRIDLLKYGIKVTSISPGMVDTEFSLVRFKGNKQTADNVYKGITPLYALDIAEAILYVVSRKPHVNINDMLIMPTAQASATIKHVL